MRRKRKNFLGKELFVADQRDPESTDLDIT